LQQRQRLSLISHGSRLIFWKRPTSTAVVGLRSKEEGHREEELDMDFTWRRASCAVLAAALLLLAATPGQAQTYGRIGVQYSTPPGHVGVDAPSAYYGVATYGSLNGYPPRVYAGIASGNLPT
jgi:hypothetical protein